ncbi:MAG: hypothetical protein IT291_03630 [Deltaproteobacteria bacterium]|nr:hypothetical protein [Deltaproteobacteria bacterium]
MYSDEDVFAIYELGRLYYEMGYFTPAERIFSGLSTVDDNRTPARLAVGLIKLERGLFKDSIKYFRAAIEESHYTLPAKLALCAAFIAEKEMSRAKTMLIEIAPQLEQLPSRLAGMRILWEALVLRCEEG